MSSESSRGTATREPGEDCDFLIPSIKAREGLTVKDLRDLLMALDSTAYKVIAYKTGQEDRKHASLKKVKLSKRKI